jgi:hypothetical protein
MYEKYKIVLCGLFLLVICIPILSGAIEKKLEDNEHIFNPLLNNPPNTPIIVGPISGKLQVCYPYNITATDPDGDDLYLHVHILQPDGNEGVIDFGPIHSGETVTTEFVFNDIGIQTIRARANDIYGLYSDWGTLKVFAPKNKLFNMNPLFQYFLELLSERFPQLIHVLS